VSGRDCYAGAPGARKEGSNTMLALRYLLMILGVGLFGSAGSLVVYDIFISEQLRRLLARNKRSEAGRAAGAGIMPAKRSVTERFEIVLS
jgi:hypothetical protein